MGQFKPMVKMETTEPSVILKLKKGGKVAGKADGGFMPMASTQPAGLPARGGMAPSAAPMKPSMAMRRRAMMAAAARPAMNPNMMKKGGKAEKHEDAAEDRAMIKKAMAGKKFASGGEIDATMDKTTIKGNTGKFVNTKVVDGDKNDSAKGTSGVKNGNKGGFAAGGTIKGGDWENKPADTAKPGKSGGATGGVRNGNAGGYKAGGAAKKHYATGGNVVNDGRAVAMPKKPVSGPVANSLQSGTFKRGGKVSKFSGGDLVDASKGAFDRALDTDEDMPLAKTIRSIPGRLYEGAKSLAGIGKDAGAGRGFSNPKSITKTEKSVTVEPRKRGGRC